MATKNRATATAKSDRNGAQAIPGPAARGRSDGAARPQRDPNRLTPLGEKIFLDRYALKDVKKETITVDDTVVVCTNLETGQREIGRVRTLEGRDVQVELRDGSTIDRPLEHVDKPLEISPSQMLDRVAQGIAAVEATPEKQAEWGEKFRWLLDDWKFVPGGRILTAAGTDQNLTFYNCYVIPSPLDSRRGIIETLSQMTEIMSRGGGVGINLSSLRPRHAYVKGVNGRSSGSVSWGALYSFVTGLIEQGGCLTPDTLVFTENGLLRLGEIIKHQDPGWQKQTLTIMTDEGERVSRQVYNNGIAEVLQVNTDMGLSLTGTPNHKVKVMTSSGPEWRRLDELRNGDAIMVKLGQHQGKFQALRKPAYHHHNQDRVALPTILDEELAFFLGYFIGDGFMTSKEGDWRLGVAVSHESYLIEEMPLLIQRLFSGVNVRTQQKENDASLIYVISNRAVKEFMWLNGFDRSQSGEVCVPRLIRQSPPQVVGAFLRGLFEADGGLSHNYPSLCSVSKPLIDEVAVLLIGLGCPVKIEQQPASEDRYGQKPVWRLRIHSFRGLENWRRTIGCDSRSRFAGCLNFEPDKTREVTYKLPYAEYWLEPVLANTTLPQTDPRATGQRFKATDQELRRKLLRYLRGDRNLTMSAYDLLSQSHPAFADSARPVNDVWFVFVDHVTQAGQSLTLDLEVDDNHTYLANGLVTHNSRRGALMLILNVWHPDVLEFIESKRVMGRITNANISVGITDDFMEAVRNDADWELVFPDTSFPGYDDEGGWDGDLEKWRAAGRPVVVHKTVKARGIWRAIVESAWASAEPGVFFVERYNKMSNSWYYAPILCTNPCGEQGLPAWGVCNLGAINLSRFVTGDQVDWPKLRQSVRYSVRFLDNVIDATPYFFEQNRAQQLAERRVGLGVMGLAEMLIRVKIRYGSPESVDFIEQLFRFIAIEAYLASADYAAEKGAFAQFDADKFLQSGYMQQMPDEVRQAIRERGVRNVTLLTVAPTGTTGTMMNTSTGIEPYYFWEWERQGRLGAHVERAKVYEDWLASREHPDEPLPNYFVTAMDLSPEEHVRVQAAAQHWVDSSISKTCNVPNHYSVEQTQQLYELMYELGVKGGTIYRDGSRDEQVLRLKEEKEEKPAAEPLSSPLRVRPATLHGNTYRKKTPVGTAYITVNANGEGAQEPFEVFINVSKAGSDVAADAEGLGRLISLILRMPSPLSPYERVQDIVSQLRGIGSGRQQGFGKQRVMSLPDAVAQALAEHVGLNATAELPGLPDMDEGTQLPLPPVNIPGDFCPECGQATLVLIEGCKKCHSCGYSEC